MTSSGSLPEETHYLEAHPSSVRSAWEQAVELALDVLEQTRCSLMLSFRFLDVALWRMPLRATSLDKPLATDGYELLFDPVKVVLGYRKAPASIVRDYLHLILHCVFRHTFDDRHPSKRAWDTACDVAVEACAMELAGLRYPCAGDGERTRALEKVRSICGDVTAQKVYRAIVADPEDEDAGADADGLFGNDASEESGPRKQSGDGARAPKTFSAQFVMTLSELFARDDHDPWTRSPERPVAHAKVDRHATLRDDSSDELLKGPGPDEESEAREDANQEGMNQPGAPAPSSGGSAAEGGVENGDRFVMANSRTEAEAQILGMADVTVGDYDVLTWKDISQQIELDLEAFIGKIGSTSGTFEINLSISNRKRFDYRSFLKRFAALSEEMKVSTDEFDYIFYTLGLKRYGNMPLVEPLEYQETNRIRDFAIVIDTSASCAGRLVRRFAEKTYDVLKNSEGFGHKVNIHVIQCDSDIRRDVKVTSIRDLDKGFEEFNLRGFGGTDFRPAFKYIDELVEKREFTKLQGIIYFTDGLGKYPAL
ncbi:MAG: hypothetical protein IJH04_03205, partial [Eggerthellaceae bacterium]|nr:hypothetical protein [Eggerthellaceae bacterium]